MAMAARRKVSVIAQVMKKYIWGRHWAKGTFLLLLNMFQHFGHDDIYKADVHKDRLERKKYVGMWRQASPRWL